MRRAALALLLAGCGGYENIYTNPPERPIVERERPTMTAAELLAVRDAQPFRSREQLLQIFHVLLGRPGDLRFVMPEPEIQKLAASLETLFPLRDCRRIEYDAGMLWLVFDEDQLVSVPDASAQIGLSLSREIGLKLTRDGDTTTCAVTWGGLRMNGSLLLHWLYPMAHDIQADRLEYAVAENNSTVIARQTVRVPAGRVRVTTSEDEIVVDVDHPQFPDDEDVVYHRESIDLYGVTYELTPPDRVTIEGTRARIDAELYDVLRALIDDAFRAPAALAHDLQIEMSAAYNLEARRLRFEFSFP